MLSNGNVLIVLSLLFAVQAWIPSPIPSFPTSLASAPVDSDFAKAVPASDEKVDPNRYNVDLETAASQWTVTVAAQTKLARIANVPYLDTKEPSNYFVDDVVVRLSRTNGESLGISFQELAGGRDDEYGLTIVDAVSGHAEKAGVLAGDSLASITVVQNDESNAIDVKETSQTVAVECRNFDATIGPLAALGEDCTIVLGLKRIRTWPKIATTVYYPPIQCAEGVDNRVPLTLTAGENLKRALQTRNIVLEDRDARKCDFCGAKCTVRVLKGMALLSPMSTTEQKILRQNPGCRLSCKTVVGHNMQQGELEIQVNVNEWKNTD